MMLRGFPLVRPGFVHAKTPARAGRTGARADLAG